MKVPLVDLRAQYAAIKDEVAAAIQEVLDCQAFILGPQVERLERDIAAYSGVEFAIGVASGSDALLLSLMAVGIGPGDAVITSPYTFFATAGAISRVCAQPVFADIDPETYNIDPMKVAELLEGKGHLRARVKAIIPVHLFGLCADMKPLEEVASRHSLTVIEDAAQAIGAEYSCGPRQAGGMGEARWTGPASSRKAGSMGALGCFSFFPTKNLGAYGDGGMVVTNDPALAEKVRQLRVHGSSKKYHHRLVGCNSRLDAIQAAVLLVKLRHLEEWTEARRERARRYDELFAASGLTDVCVTPRVKPVGSRHVYHQYVVRVERRDELMRYLEAAGIGTAVYYPLPLHLQECYRGLGYSRGDFPEAERAAHQTMALPLYPELTDEQTTYVVEKIREFYV